MPSTYRYPAGTRPACSSALVGQLEHVAVLADDDVVAGHAHDLAEAGVGHHVAELAVHRHEPLGVGDRQVRLDLVGLGVAGGVHVHDPGVHDLGAGLEEAVHHAVDVALVARDGVAGQDHGVVVAELDEPVLAAGQQGQRRHRLALRTGRDHADLAGRVLVDVLDVDDRAGRDVHDPEVQAELHVLAHAHPERGDLAAALDGGVGDLLDAVQVAGEAGRDDPPVAVAGEQRRAARRRRSSRSGRTRPPRRSSSRTAAGGCPRSWPARRCGRGRCGGRRPA